MQHYTQEHIQYISKDRQRADCSLLMTEMGVGHVCSRRQISRRTSRLLSTLAHVTLQQFYIKLNAELLIVYYRAKLNITTKIWPSFVCFSASWNQSFHRKV